jgi:hypothetical protein
MTANQHEQPVELDAELSEIRGGASADLEWTIDVLGPEGLSVLRRPRPIPIAELVVLRAPLPHVNPRVLVAASCGGAGMCVATDAGLAEFV